MQIKIYSPAKINLTLDALSRREDGYHELCMIMQTVSLYDSITIRRIRSGLQVKTNLYYLPTDKRNLVYRAAQSFFDQIGQPPNVFIHVLKRIPVAAGLAGGSSNAAAVLLGLNKMHGRPIDMPRLLEMGKELGADVPYCMLGGTQLAEGIGDKLTKLPAMPQCYMVIVKPSISISTPVIFKGLDVENLQMHPDTVGMMRAIEQSNLKDIAVRLYNVLETVAIPKYPVIQSIKQSLLDHGAIASVMSGSGPSVYGIFPGEQAAKSAMEQMQKIYRDVFVVHTCGGINIGR